jgi:hypothetical protein
MIAEMQRDSWAVTAGASIAMLCPSYDSVEDANSQACVQRPNRLVASRGSMASVVHGEVVPPIFGIGSFSAAVAERPTRTARLAAVWSRIQSYATLKPGWAGPSTEAPSAITISRARQVLNALPYIVDVPLVAASGDGEIVFTWLVGHDRIEASLDDEGYLSWACRVAGVVSPGGSIALVNEPLTMFTELLVSRYA